MSFTPPEDLSRFPHNTVHEPADFERAQSLMAHAVMRPLTAEYDMQPTHVDGSSMHDHAASFIAPTDALSSFQRLEIYNRQYWYRILDSLEEDFPGLLAILGRDQFNRLARAYLTAHPSRSFTLRDLGQDLPQFLADHPKLAGRRPSAALQMARLEWAKVVAFDGAEREPLDLRTLEGQNPLTVTLSLQPHLTLLSLDWPFDKWLLTMRQTDRSHSESATENEPSDQETGSPRALPNRSKVFLAIYRFDNSVFYKRLDRIAFHILSEIRLGYSLMQACERIVETLPPKRRSQDLKLLGTELQDWFTHWTTLGWFWLDNAENKPLCLPPSTTKPIQHNT